MDDDVTEWKTTRIDNSRPPLRWIANLAGHLASNAMIKMVDMQEAKINAPISNKINGLIWKKLWPIYEKWGTFYDMEFEIDEE